MLLGGRGMKRVIYFYKYLSQLNWSVNDNVGKLTNLGVALEQRYVVDSDYTQPYIEKVIFSSGISMWRPRNPDVDVFRWASCFVVVGIVNPLR